MRRGTWIASGSLLLFAFTEPVPAAAAPVPTTSCQVFPADNIWNTDISALPVHPRSAQWLASMAATTNLHPDFGAPPYGFPFNVVDHTHQTVSVSFQYASESDLGPYPVGSDTLIENGSDHHALIINRDTCVLYELFNLSGSGSSWSAGSGAIFPLGSDALRPSGWTSADAAGLPIFPGLVRWDEVQSGAINHAIRFTAQQTDQSFLWPARHEAGTAANPSLPPMGARFRLKASYDISHFSPQAQVILRALQHYGLILADNGSNWFFSGTEDASWPDSLLTELKTIPASQFEAVDESSLLVDPNSASVTPPIPWEAEGGVLASAPSASTWGSGRLDAFVAGVDGILYHRYLSAGAWQWEALPGVAPTSVTSSVSTVAGSIDVFVRGADLALWRKSFNAGVWGSWQRLGGVLAGEPSAVSIGGGAIDVFVEGTDRHLWYINLSGSSATWHLAGGILAAAPAAASVSGSTHAFVMGTDGGLWQFCTVGGWTSLGGRIAAKPSATSGRGVLDAMVVGTDGHLWHWTDFSGGPSWELVGGLLGLPPAVASWGSSRLDVLVVGTDGALYHAWTTSTTAGGGWSWASLGGRSSDTPAAATWGAGRLDTFVRGNDGQLWHLTVP